MTIGIIGTIGLVGMLMGGTVVSSPGTSAFTMPHYGITDPTVLVGPAETAQNFVTPRGKSLEPTGTGIRRFVDGSVAISGDGLTLTTAYKTITEAVNAAGAGDLILILPGLYPEDVTTDPWPSQKGTAAHPVRLAKLSLAGAGGVVEITGTDEVNGWTACTGVSDVFGSAHWANIHYVDISLDPSPEVELKDAILQEPGANGELIMGSVAMIAEDMQNAYDMLIARHAELWFDGDDTGSSIADLTKTAETGAITFRTSYFEAANWPQGVLDNSEVWVNLAGNTNFKTEITSHVAATGDISFTNTRTEAWTTKQLALRNVPYAISGPGQWAFRDNGNGTWRIWYWPNNPANIEQVRISSRNKGIDLDNSSHWVLFGIKISGIGGPEPSDGRAGGVYAKQQNLAERYNIYFEQCRITACNGGGIALVNFDGVELYDCTIDRIPMGRGVVLNKSKRFVADGNKILLTGITALSLATAEEALISNNHIGEIRSVHGNGASAYLIAKKLWVHGNFTETKFAIGFAIQDGGDFWFTCNLFKLGPGVASRANDDNSNTPAGWGRNTTGFTSVLGHFPTPARIRYYSNTYLPWAGADPSTAANALQIGNTTHAEHDAAGNVIFGTMTIKNGTITDTDPDPDVTYNATITPPSKNIFMGTGALGHAILSNGEGNSLVADPAGVLVDPFGYNPTPASGGYADVSAGDLSARLPLAESWFTALPNALAIVQRDFARNPIVWTSAPTGCIAPPTGAGGPPPPPPPPNYTEVIDIYDGTELRNWWDARQLVDHTDNAVSTWTCRVSGAVLGNSFAPPTYIANAAVRFADDIDDQMKGPPAIDFSAYPTSTIYGRVRAHGTENFVIAGMDRNATPWILIAAQGDTSNDICPGLPHASVTIAGQVVTTRAQVWTAFSDQLHKTFIIDDAGLSGMTNFAMTGYSSVAFNGPVEWSQFVITEAALSGDAAAKRAALIAFLDAQNPS